MKVLIVVAHPRSDSLTHQAAAAFADALRAGGETVESADLHAEGFNPVLGPEDEPNWDDPRKRYSTAVREEMARVERNDATVLVFPVWWWSMPAMLKGWIDRVWNNGWAYGEAEYPHRRVWAIAIAGASEAAYEKRGYDKAISVQIESGIFGYCGVKERRLAILYGTLEGQAEQVTVQARALGAAFSHVEAAETPS
ncbi:MAG: NAD(P)H oxidoreductase [Hansschlegelia sp.]